MGLALTFVIAQTAVCLPGTTVCAESDGRGGVRIDASGRAQGSPSGASANGQVGAAGDASADARARTAAQTTSSTGTGYYRSSHGRFGTGAGLCAIARVGVWSGIKAGGCIGVGFRWEAAALELETQLLYGGTTNAYDWSFPISLVVPLARGDSLFDGPYLRFGGSPIGATFARERDGGSFVRFGWFAGGGYELNLARWVAWRVFDLRLALDIGTRRAMDDHGHLLDPGIQLGTGLTL